MAAVRAASANSLGSNFGIKTLPASPLCQSTGSTSAKVLAPFVGTATSNIELNKIMVTTIDDIFFIFPFS
jgi:hypothetical protein